MSNTRLNLVLAPDGSILQSGPAAARALGIPAEAGALVGVRLLDRVHPDDLPTAEALLAWPLEAPRTATLRLVYGDGTAATCRVDVARLDARRVVCRVEMPTRIAPSAEAERLRQLQRLSSVGALAGGLAHDLNNFLTAILGYASLTLAKTADDDPRRRMLAPLKDCSERAAALGHRMLTFSRATTGTQRVVSAGQLIEDTLSVVRPGLPKNVELTVDAPDGSLHVFVDPTALEQVLVNLCLNARDALAADGALSVRTDRVFVDETLARDHPGARVGYHVAIEVADDGTGIPPDVLPRIFEAFFSTKGPGSGTGLGLANVATIVREHGGFVTVASRAGRGTTFRVHLPEAHDAKPIDPAPAPDGLVAGTGTVLVVARDDSVRGLAREILAHAGYRVLESTNGGEAVLVLGMNRDVVAGAILDDALPTLGGREWAELLRDMNPDLPVLLLGAASGNDDRSRDARTSALGKPFDAAALSGAVHALLAAPPDDAPR